MKLQVLLDRIAGEQLEAHAACRNTEAYFAQFACQQLAKSETLQAVFHISQLEMEEIYAEAFYLYEENSYQRAQTHFRWLVLLDPFTKKYWMGLGAAHQMARSFERALESYAMLALLDPSSPHPYFHAYECYDALGKKEEASVAFQAALDCAPFQENDAHLKSCT